MEGDLLGVMTRQVKEIPINYGRQASKDQVATEHPCHMV